MPAKVLVAIPAYKCEAQIGRVLAGFDERLFGRVHKVIVIDNRSPDGTLNAAVNVARAYKKIEVVRNRENYGLGGTHKVAFIHAEDIGADYVAILHGDAQARTEELHALLDEADRDRGLSAVLGARFMPRSRLRGYSAVRIAGNIGLNAAYTLLSGRLTWDMGSGLNLFRVSDLTDHQYLGFSNGFTFNMDLLLHYYSRGARLKYVPITWAEEDQVSNARTFEVGWITLKTLLKWRLTRGPEKVTQLTTDYSFETILS